MEQGLKQLCNQQNNNHQYSQSGIIPLCHKLKLDEANKPFILKLVSKKIKRLTVNSNKIVKGSHKKSISINTENDIRKSDELQNELLINCDDKTTKKIMNCKNPTELQLYMKDSLKLNDNMPSIKVMPCIFLYIE